MTRLLAALCGDAARPLADQLLDRFGSIPALLRSGPAALDALLPDRRDVSEVILAAGALMTHALRTRLLSGPVLPGSQAVLDYLFAQMADEPAEQVRVLYLDTRNRLVRDDVATRGTVNRADIFPREIVRRALELGATGIIVAHNHPSGDPRPSKEDIKATRLVADAARLFDIMLHDHIIIGRGGWCSLRGEGYL